MKKVSVVLMALIMMFAMAACGGSSDAPAGDAAMIDVTIEIDFPDVDGQPDVEDYKFQIPEGSTALDMLNLYAEAESVEIVMSDTSATAYVTSIGGVAETDGAGWVYEVDDEMTLDAADEHIVKQGAEITWEYMSWDEMGD